MTTPNPIRMKNAQSLPTRKVRRVLHGIRAHAPPQDRQVCHVPARTSSTRSRRCWVRPSLNRAQTIPKLKGDGSITGAVGESVLIEINLYDRRVRSTISSPYPSKPTTRRRSRVRSRSFLIPRAART